jgi:hypothetical protein
MHMSTPLDLVYFGAAIALIAIALYFTHASEGGGHGEASARENADNKHGH